MESKLKIQIKQKRVNRNLLALLCFIIISSLLFFSCMEKEINYGSGTSELHIDFDETTEEIDLKFVYTWEGKTTGADLIKSVASKNDQLYLNMDNSNQVIYGIVWDKDNDGNSPTWGVNPDQPTHIDPHDLYGYGWKGVDGGNPQFNHYWGYYISDKENNLTFSNSGMASRILTDKSIDLWKLTPLK